MHDIVSPEYASQRILHIGALVADLQTKRAEFAGKALQLTDKEYLVLELLLLRKGQIVTREMLMNHLYEEPEAKDSIIDVFLSRLRKKIGTASGGTVSIETLFKQGYVLQEKTSAKPTRK
ncbi:MAG: winged helix-turn-helix domain-containing protein [Candidatus Pacebacteria bacterium]|nr:winged helix-turn-helix domain-containing protein [Candidatus Paceibacterota bacterium]